MNTKDLNSLEKILTKIFKGNASPIRYIIQYIGQQERIWNDKP